MANLLDDTQLKVPFSVMECTYVRGAVRTYIKSLKSTDEKEVLLLWLRKLENFLNTSAVISNTDKPF